ncbi:S-adenosyl-L-methionine-dependent methyltransferase [Mycotypha africana]|uniref:S-adenosyl-L-methionine-dependent methyltransferase n=1 Tax=Mycotypha africana TaxID=64632 RepID=UPI0023018B9D|nr:S-adenosyl-L-methionine-dependent methyltransferase [Mycotypha africana]KAI8982191.1 S-adenosyl-L-methionine-dependent methyltransferase [Mycotypha africana]
MTKQHNQQDVWSADNYNKHASFVPKLGSVILDMLNPQAHENILDLGCGDGLLTKQLANRCRSVTGIDASTNMVTKAKQSSNAENISYHVVDAFDLDKWFDDVSNRDHSMNSQKFDAVFSSAVMHWLKKDPEKVLLNIKHVLKQGGRFVAEFGGFMNIGEIQTALIAALNKRGHDGENASPWFFPSDEHYKTLLEEAGFSVLHCELVPRMTVLTTDVVGWIDTFGFDFLKVLPNDEEREKVKKEVQEQLRPAYQREDGKWVVMYVRLRVVALKR